MQRQKTNVATVPAALALVAVTVVGLGGRAAPQERSTTRTAGLEVMHVQGNVHVIAGAGANIALSVGPSGALLVDTGRAEFAEDVLAVVKGLSPKLPIQYIVNTQFKEDHAGANEAIAKAGTRIAIGFAFGDRRTQAAVVAHENILNRMSAPVGQVAPRPVGAWPTDTFFSPTKEIYFNNEAVLLYHNPGETDGDTFVFFRKSDVIAAGDLYINTMFPVIDLAAGGHINGIIEGLNDILEIVVPANNVEDGTLVIPGEGRLADELDVAEYRDMVTIVRDRVQDAIRRGLTKEQVLAEKRMTLEYDGRYGKNPKWTTAMFLDAVYTNLTQK